MCNNLLFFSFFWWKWASIPNNTMCAKKCEWTDILIAVLEFSYGKMYAVIRLYNKMWGKAKFNMLNLDIYLVNT